MLSWAILWDVIKVLVFPVVGLLYAMFKQKITKQDAEIEKLKQETRTLENKLTRMEATFVTQDQVNEWFKDLRSIVENSNDILEKRIEKTIDLKMDPIKDLLNKLVNTKP